MSRDRGAIVVGGLVKIMVPILVVGVTAFDVLSVGATRRAVSDQADTAAQVAAREYQQNHSVNDSYQAALAYVTDADEGNAIDPADFTVAPDGVITLRLTREAHTFVAHLVPPLRDQLTASAQGRASTTP